MSDNLSKLFGINELKATLPEPNKEDHGLDEDAVQARQNIKTLIETGNQALAEALDLAIQSESPRAYEVLTNLINTLADLNSRVIDVHGKTADIKKKSNTRSDGQPAQHQTIEGPVNNTTNNIVFTGTTAELSTYLATLRPPKPTGDIIENEPKQD